MNRNSAVRDFFTPRRRSCAFLWYLNIDNQVSRTLRRHIRSAKFGEAERILATTQDTNEQTYLYESAADWNRTYGFLRAWFSNGSETAEIVRAIHETKLQWRGLISTIRKTHSRTRSAVLDTLDADFTSYSSRHPNAAFQLYWHISIARAMGNAEYARELYQASLANASENKANAWASLQTESTEWFGSAQQLYDYCFWLMPQLPDRIGAPTLVVEAHYLNSFCLDPTYLESPRVRDDIVWAYESCLNRPIDGVCRVRSLHYLAWGLMAVSEYTRAKVVFNQLQGAPPGSPWGSFKFGLDALFGEYQSQRRRALRFDNS